MRIPAIRLADAHALANAGSRTYMYEFAWSSPGLGAVHALEIPFVFDTATTDAPLFGPMLGEDPPQELARTMHAAWVAFAGTGDPGWPRYDLGRRATMRFDTVSRVVEDPRSWERGLWTGIAEARSGAIFHLVIGINGGWSGPYSRSHEGCPCRPLSTPCWCCSW